MDNHLTIRVPRRLIKATLVLALVAAVISPIAVSAAHTFSDVPDTNIFHEDITWMADNGVTAGCNPPANDNYCPKDNVTREQMAAFMRRLAENQVVDAATAVTAESADNAGMVDGYDANSLTRVAYDVDESGDPVTVNGLVDVESVMSVEITAPTGGYITVHGHTELTHNTDVGFAFCQISVDDIDGNPGADILDGSQVGYGLSQNGYIQGCSTDAGFVSFFGGTYTVNFDVAVFAHNVNADEGTLVAHFTPFNGAGNVPFGTIIIPPIITLGETARELAATSPEIAARLPEILDALD